MVMGRPWSVFWCSKLSLWVMSQHLVAYMLLSNSTSLNCLCAESC